MNKLIGFALAAVLLSCTGCILTSTESQVPPPVAETAVRLPTPTLVTANQVTEEKYRHKIAAALGKELDREAQQDKLNAVP